MKVGVNYSLALYTGKGISENVIGDKITDTDSSNLSDFTCLQEEKQAYKTRPLIVHLCS